MVINCPSPIKIAIIDGAPIEAPESDSEEFTYQVGKEVGEDFDDDQEGEDVVFNCIRQAPSTYLFVVRCAFHNQKKRTIGESCNFLRVHEDRRRVL